VDFVAGPLCGWMMDNIYTQNSNVAKYKEQMRGNPPVLGGKLTPACLTDSFVYP
jgi:hypothetical protein